MVCGKELWALQDKEAYQATHHDPILGISIVTQAKALRYNEASHFINQQAIPVDEGNPCTSHRHFQHIQCPIGTLTGMVLQREPCVPSPSG